MIGTIPTDVLGHACSFGAPLDLARLDCAGKATSLFLRSHAADATVWRTAVAGLWSPRLQLLPDDGCASWRAAALFLEKVAYAKLRSDGVKAALKCIFAARLAIPAATWCSPLALDVVRAALQHRGDLESRRRIALFACSSDFAVVPPAVTGAAAAAVAEEAAVAAAVSAPAPEDSNLLAVLSSFGEIAAAVDPEDALRRLLLAFPFLPIDAGEGADRVIKLVARLYLDSHPSEYAELRGGGGGGGGGGECHDDAESAVYILIYAVIMLNTDLHHPAIRTKMSAAEFVRSARSTVLGVSFRPSDLERIYASVAATPLAICASLGQQRALPNLLDQKARVAAAAVAATAGTSARHRCRGLWLTAAKAMTLPLAVAAVACVATASLALAVTPRGFGISV